MRRVAGDGSTGGRDDGDGPAVLLVRGFADSSALWLHRLPALTAAGCAPSHRICTRVVLT